MFWLRLGHNKDVAHSSMSFVSVITLIQIGFEADMFEAELVRVTVPEWVVSEIKF